MFYFKRIEDNSLYAGTEYPKKPELFIEITEEEYSKLLESLEEEPVNG